MPWKTICIVAGLAVVGWAGTMALLSLMARPPAGLGLQEGRLAACPPSPNCVSSEEGTDAAHAVAPLSFTDDPDDAWERLRRALAGMPRTTVVTGDDGYLHAECRSLLFRFVDDLECRPDAGAKVIHVRSASRVGQSDLGVNRTRVEDLRRRFDELAEQP